MIVPLQFGGQSKVWHILFLQYLGLQSMAKWLPDDDPVAPRLFEASRIFLNFRFFRSVHLGLRLRNEVGFILPEFPVKWQVKWWFP